MPTTVKSPSSKLVWKYVLATLVCVVVLSVVVYLLAICYRRQNKLQTRISKQKVESFTIELKEEGDSL